MQIQPESNPTMTLIKYTLIAGTLSAVTMSAVWIISIYLAAKAKDIK